MLGRTYSKLDFQSILFERNCLPDGYRNVTLDLEDGTLDLPSCEGAHREGNRVVQHFPGYLVPQVDPKYRLFKTLDKKGYAVHLKGYASVEDYFDAHLKRSSKKAIKRALNRFEHCFEVSYTMFYRSISRDTYNFLLEALYKMISDRFKDRYTTHTALKQWEYYHSLFYRLVSEGRGSIFVIFDREIPIEISLNFNFGNIMLSAFSSFNADYAKFSLGNIEIYKQLEWCLENGYVLFDMSYGDFKYKMDWSNLHYDFETHVISKTSLGGPLASFLEKKGQITNYFIKKEVNHTYHRIKSILKGERGPKEPDGRNIDFTLEKVDTSEMDKINGLKRVNLVEPQWNRLKRYVYDYLYLEQKRLQDITIYQKSETKFLIKSN
ncbi:MAG: GNAT family N-acetyltransferase [Bacteroidota bacterium]